MSAILWANRWRLRCDFCGGMTTSYKDASEMWFAAMRDGWKVRSTPPDGPVKSFCKPCVLLLADAGRDGDLK